MKQREGLIKLCVHPLAHVFRLSAERPTVANPEILSQLKVKCRQVELERQIWQPGFQVGRACNVAMTKLLHTQYVK